MRIIAGRFRRRKLFTNPGLVTRPITDRVKETLFERIGQTVKDARVADIFSGTGTIGLESLSRGAKSVVFIEKDRKAIDLLRDNVAMLDCEKETLVWPADVRRCSFRPKGGNDHFVPFDLIFFDPPYKMVKDILPESPLWLSLRRLARDDVSSPGATLVFRSPEHATFELPERWAVDWTLTMSNMVVSVCRKRPAEPGDSELDQQELTGEEIVLNVPPEEPLVEDDDLL
ncbi:MAG: 16S rRNA (guanine(966)-N(2))-methyltransferase RsmD [Planctomycetaceae bacterium]|nr:16S rRNA (guanine(966)-N(2))-methyltransferase RsmD [Planctomycetaceae bacterium]